MHAIVETSFHWNYRARHPMAYDMLDSKCEKTSKCMFQGGRACLGHSQASYEIGYGVWILKERLNIVVIRRGERYIPLRVKLCLRHDGTLLLGDVSAVYPGITPPSQTIHVFVNIQTRIWHSKRRLGMHWHGPP